jgi:two-component system response regulator CpxR
VTQIANGVAPRIQNTLLVVDDDTDMREALRDVLLEEGYRVVLAANGKIALGLLPTLQRPCGMILDITMPVMSGTELYRAMRAVPALDDIPVVFLTSDPSSAPSGLPLMPKSIRLERLLGAVASLMRAPSPAGTAASPPADRS